MGSAGTMAGACLPPPPSGAPAPPPCLTSCCCCRPPPLPPPACLPHPLGLGADPAHTLRYALDVTQKLVVSRDFRHEVGGCHRRRRWQLRGLFACAVRGGGSSSSWRLSAIVHGAWGCRTAPSPACWACRLPPQVLRLVVRLYEGVPAPDYGAICQCLVSLGDAAEVAAILHTLLRCGGGSGGG